MTTNGINGSVVLGASLIGAAALTYHMTKKARVIDPFYDFENQSVEIDEKEHIRVCCSIKGKPLIEYRLADVRTLYNTLPKGLETSSNGPCLGKREGPGKGPYSWMTYSEVLEKVKYIGSGVIHKGIESGNSTNIGIYSVNRCEWIIAEHACYSYSQKVVSLYDSYGKDAIKYILNHAEIKAIFVDTFARLLNIVSTLNDVSHLKLIVHFNDLTSRESAQIESYRSMIEIISFNSLLDVGKANPYPHKPPKPDDIATVCYTSGTTGMPKGALLSHGNIIANEAAIFERCNKVGVEYKCFKPHLGYDRSNPRPVHISYLPLAHMMERQSSVNVFMVGGQIGYLSGDIQTLLDDIQELKPISMPLVPRLLNKLYNETQNQIKNSPLKKHLLNRALSIKKDEIQRGIYQTDTIYDKLIFNKIRAKFGGRAARVGTGSAPISDEVMIFCRAALGCPIPEGYGQTEATCGITFTHPFDPVLGHQGPPVSCCMVKLIDVPEMDYYSNKNQGEICAKGTNIFKGYLKDEEKTAEAIDKDGWLHTGDIGMWLSNGTLKIIDRKKNLFKLSQGEYISPEKIENIYSRSPFAAQVFVDGSSLKDYIVGVVVPDPDYLAQYCKKAGISGDFESLCKNEKIKDLILNDLKIYGKAADLMSYEQVKTIHLHPILMSLENGLTTPTMKIKRLECRKYFKDIVAKLYDEELPEAGKKVLTSKL